MAGKILTVVETEAGRVRDCSYELVTLARELARATGGAACAAVLGADPAAAAAQVAGHGVETVYAVKDPALAAYTADGWVATLKQLIAREGVEVVLFSHTPLGWDAAPRLAAVHGLPALTEIVAVVDGGKVWTRLMFNGKFQVKMTLAGTPAVVTVQKGAFPPCEERGDGAVKQVAAGLDPAAIRQKYVETTSAPAQGKVDLASADIIVSGGRSLGSMEKFGIIKELADALGGQVGASRPVTDAGWLPHEHQVGSSGITVKPKLYIASGISGAIQHIVGMKQSGYIVAINKDKEAPIFEVADVCIIGDQFEIVPALTKAILEARGRG
jgi:electron transfer flavoprotein alpha subunit